MTPIRIGLLGFGTVGQGVLNLLTTNQETIRDRSNCDLQVVAIAKRNWEGISIPAGIDCFTDALALAKHAAIDIVVEVIGGTDLAFDAISAALRAKKHVVTANKALIAEKGEQLFALAKQHQVQLFFEAAVAGGIPIIKALKESLSGNETECVAGIINGTSNYILSAMHNEGRDFAEVLAEAQALGYAEADPTFDIEGVDAAHKLTILAAIAFGLPLDFKQLAVEGISKITAQDVAFASELGYCIKHLGMAIKTTTKTTGEGAIELRVHPTLVPKTSLISQVNGVLNAVSVKDNAVGETLFCGAGAGSLPTASAVVADLISICQHLDGVYSDPLGFCRVVQAPAVVPVTEHVSAHYLHLRVEDKMGVLATIAGLLAKQQINIEALLQKEPSPDHQEVSIVILTQPVAEQLLQNALAELRQLPALRSDIARIRLAHF